MVLLFETNMTPLHMACQSCYQNAILETANLLIQSGADVNAKVVSLQTLWNFTSNIIIIRSKNDETIL